MISNGVLEYINNLLGSLANLQCLEGSSMSGTGKYICGSLGNWLGSGRCGMTTNNMMLTLLHQMYRCQKVALLKILLNTTSMARPILQLFLVDLIDCSNPPMISDGYFKYIHSTFGSVANLQCSEGHSITGHLSYTCGANGSWVGFGNGRCGKFLM